MVIIIIIKCTNKPKPKITEKQNQTNFYLDILNPSSFHNSLISIHTGCVFFVFFSFDYLVLFFFVKQLNQEKKLIIVIILLHHRHLSLVILFFLISKFRDHHQREEEERKK